MPQAIGMFRMRDEMGIDNKVLCVAVTDPRMAHLRDIEDVSELDRLEIHHFEVYKVLEPGKEVETATWVDQATAQSGIEACRERAQRWPSGRLAERPGAAARRTRPPSSVC
jgi:inorganic pyrophosphatase